MTAHSLDGADNLTARVNTRRSFARFIYPLLFEPDTFERRVAAVQDATWRSSDRSAQVWERDPFRTDNVLAHVASFLDPDGDCAATALRWKLTNQARQSPAGLGNASWTLISNARRERPRFIPFSLDDVELTLFSSGVGMVSLCVVASAAEPAAWTDLLHHFRFARGQRDVAVRAVHRYGADLEQPFFPHFAGGEASLDANGNGQVMHLLTGLLTTVRVADDPDTWWHEVFVPGQLMPYACLLVDGAGAGALVAFTHQVRSFFGSHQRLHPTDADLDLDHHPSVLTYAEKARFAFSLDGAAFVAGDLPDTPFFRDQLPEHLGTSYYLLFLLVLHQRFALMRLSSQVAACWRATPTVEEEMEQEAAVNRVRTEFLQFTARGYFAQVMQQEHHHAAYRKWQEVLQIERLYHEVRDEVREMSQHVLERRTRRIAEAQVEAAKREQAQAQHDQRRDATLGMLAAVLGGPALALSFLSVIGPVSTTEAVLGSLIGLAVGVVILIGVIVFVRRRLPS